MKAEDVLCNYPEFNVLADDVPTLEDIIAKSKNLKSEENLRTIFSLIDLTTLDVTDTTQKVREMCEKVNQFPSHFSDMPNVASICIYPSLVETVKQNLKAKDVGITSVSAGFPASQTFIEVKELETEIAILDGATEVDIVMSVGKFLEGKYKQVAAEIRDIKKLMNRVHLKVILETGALNNDQIYVASALAMKEGADFIKTSTGKYAKAATPEAVYAMCLTIKEHHRQTGRKVGIKPAGGIATTEDALIYFSIVREILGEAWLSPKFFRIGASRLANNLLGDLAEIKGSTFKPYF